MPSLYDLSIATFISSLKILSGLLEKGVAHTGDGKSLVESRLIEDMHALPFQIQSASNGAKFFAIRVAGVPNVPWEDNETTIPQLQERISKTIAFLEALDPKIFEGKDDAEVVMRSGLGEHKFTATTYLTKFSLPNFYFHFVTAYNLLRKEGVPIGKNDYLGGN